MEALRLPRRVEEDPDARDLAQEIVARARPLWSGGKPRAPQAELTPDLEAALRSAFSAGQVVRGLEAADRVLAGEERGQRKVDRRTGQERGGRISRLLLLADDGAERFYRRAEALLQQHAPRVLALRLAVDQVSLGKLLFGPDEVARLLLVEHKDAVSAVLLALSAQWARPAPRYGEGDASYRAAGERAGIAKLVDAFYRIMDERREARGIRRMHPQDLAESRDKLTRFLCGWLNGPKLYAEKYGPIKLPAAHARFRIGPDERDAWLDCMERAIAEQDYDPGFAAYLARELGKPAQRVLETSRDPEPSADRGGADGD